MENPDQSANVSACDIEVFFFAHETAANQNPTIHPTVLSSFTALVKGTLSFIPKSSDECLLSARIARMVYRPYASESLDLRDFRRSPSLVQFEIENNVELVMLPWRPTPRPLRLAVFDMDSTLIDQEVIDELARTIDKAPEVADITERAMRGELDFADSLKARVKLLEGVRADVWESLRSSITLAKGAKELCQALKSNGVKMAVFSGGFQPMAEWLKGELGLDIAVANHLVSSPPTSEYPFAHLVGELVPDVPIVTAERKQILTQELAKENSIPLSEVMCVGDGANDLLMLKVVGEAGGVAVACRAKDKVQKEAPNRLNGKSLTDLLYILGLQKATAG